MIKFPPRESLLAVLSGALAGWLVVALLILFVRSA